MSRRQLGSAYAPGGGILEPSNAQQTLAEWLREEPFALTMSSGFFGFFAHAGVLRALEKSGLSPVRVSGSSAGALVTGLWAAGLSAQDIERELMTLQRQDFWDPALGLGFLRGKRFQSRLDELLPAAEFSSCRVPLSVSVFDVLSRQTVVLDSGPLAPALRASCTVPVLFHPLWHRGRPLLDGGVLDRPGLAGMPTQRLLYHHLASRSPWRRPGSPSLNVPDRAGLCALVIADLPRVNPFRLERGREAFRHAERAALRALAAPVPPNLQVHC